MAARASAAAWGGAISWLACAETRVLALWPLDKKFGFLFSHRYLRYFLQKKPAFGTLHCPTTCSPHPFASCFSVFSVSVAFPSFFAVFGPSLDFLHMPASTCSSLSFLCAVIFLNLLVLFGGAVRSWEVWEVFFLFVFFIFLCCLVVWCGATTHPARRQTHVLPCCWWWWCRRSKHNRNSSSSSSSLWQCDDDMMMTMMMMILILKVMVDNG